ncbi:MAG: type I-U CRISPR-associated helicase/endonuclease Cas3 [bacterium]|nr:type I-U CRISPR-associated helicase/endonuclease Cas3 [bacterium]
MSFESIRFDELFKNLTGNTPFPWQEALYQQFITDSQRNISSSCNLPTGLGKTSIVAIWLLALANKPDCVPRRLVYVVNRRTVVDQTTTEVEKYRTALQSEALQSVRERLTRLCALPLVSVGNAIASPLALSTLRGQFADNREWSADPARPAIIVGTVDMIGSRLLFSGYGIGFKGKPLHAGFLGQDVLLVHDEAHLEPAFQVLVTSIVEQQRIIEKSQNGPCPKLRVIELSATTREEKNVAEEGVQRFGLTAKDRADPMVKERFEATKVLRLVPIADEKQSAEKIAEIALDRRKDAAGQSSNAAVLIFVRTLKDVKSVCSRLTDRKTGVGEDQVRQLTGTMRGLERDKFTKSDPVFMRFLPEKSRNPAVVPTSGAAYLVCTSAGEVGIDISADHLVCDLSPFDSMAQRFGRVNRYGRQPGTRIDVVHPTEIGKKDKKTGELTADALAISRRKTLVLLGNLPAVGEGCFDASPSALGNLSATARQEAFTPPPTILPTSDILFDAWAMTSIRENMPGRPVVAPYLHGVADDLPQTSIAWRSELDLVAHDPNPTRALQEIFTKHRIRPHETVTVTSSRVIEFFKEITKKKAALRSTRIAILFPRQLVLSSIGDLIDKPGPLNAAPTLILPASFGYLNRDGLLDADAIPSETSNDVLPQLLDVADHDGYEPTVGIGTRTRVIIERSDDGWSAKPLIPGTTIATLPDQPSETSTELVNELRGDLYRVQFVQPIEYNQDDEPVRSLVSLVPLLQRPESQEQDLSFHVDRVEKVARLIAEKLNLSDLFREALLFAAKWHDEGKKAALWQRYIGGPNSNGQPLGKSANWCDPKKLSGYRHEFGSLLRIEHPQRLQTKCVPPTDSDALDLAMHLIAAHHGHARPHFSNRFDKEFSEQECEATHIETIRRFARLQRTYGRWGLAYLESLLRAADAAASAGLGTDDEMEDGIGGNT